MFQIVLYLLGSPCGPEHNLRGTWYVFQVAAQSKVHSVPSLIQKSILKDLRICFHFGKLSLNTEGSAVTLFQSREQAEIAIPALYCFIPNQPWQRLPGSKGVCGGEAKSQNGVPSHVIEAPPLFYTHHDGSGFDRVAGDAILTFSSPILWTPLFRSQQKSKCSSMVQNAPLVYSSRYFAHFHGEH